MQFRRLRRTRNCRVILFEGFDMSQRNIYRAEPHNFSRDIFFFPNLFPLFLGPKILTIMNQTKNSCHKLLKSVCPAGSLFFCWVESFASDIGYAPLTSGLPMRRRSVKIHPEIYLERWLWPWWRVLVSMWLWLFYKKKNGPKGEGKKVDKNHPVISRVKVIVPPFWGGWNAKNSVKQI